MYAVIGVKGTERVRVLRRDELEAEYTAELMRDVGYDVTVLKFTSTIV